MKQLRILTSACILICFLAPSFSKAESISRQTVPAAEIKQVQSITFPLKETYMAIQHGTLPKKSKKARASKRDESKLKNATEKKVPLPIAVFRVAAILFFPVTYGIIK